MPKDDESIRFLAIFPTIQTAIKVDGSGNGMRIQLDIPESEMGQAVMLLAMREQILDITVKPYGKNNPKQTGSAKESSSGEESGDPNPAPRRSAKKR